MRRFANVLLFTAMWTLRAPAVWAEPPDNAAVLYYKASLMYKEPEGALREAVSDASAGKHPPTQDVIDFVRDQGDAIETVTRAAEIEACNWGYDYSQGFALQMPALAHMRNLARLVLADAAIQVDQGRYDVAIQRYRTTYAMARHVKTDHLLVCHLVGIAIEALTHGNMTHLLSQMPPEPARLDRLDALLAEVQARSPQMYLCVAREAEIVGRYTSAEQIREALGGEISEQAAAPWDQEAFEKAMQYYQTRMKEMAEAFRLPYKEATAKIEAIEQQIEKDADAKTPQAVLATSVMPAISRCLSLEVRLRTHTNAMRTAVALYRIRALGGELPETLPAHLPKDLFSGEAFDYERTADGFVLRCRAKDLSKDTLHEYVFTIPK